MAGPIRGSIEHFVAGTGIASGSAQSMFVNCYNFLNDNTGTLGIQRLAYHTGAKETGMGNVRGIDFYNSVNPCGNNAFAAFRFLSASNPFEVLIQFSGASGLGTAPGSPALVNAAASTYTFAMAIAQCTVSSSWNGTTRNDGTDVKGTPVWVSGSNVAYYPRSNDHRRSGTHAAQKQNMLGISSLISADYRLHFIADYDNFVVLADTSADNSYQVLAMLKYSPVTDLTATLPYFCFSSTLPIVAGQAYGAKAGTSEGGGISFPDLITSGTCVLSFDKIGTTFFQAAATQPNRMFATQRFDEYPLYVGGFEIPDQVGLCGQHYEFVREAFNIATHDTNAAGTRACFGTTTLAQSKLTVPFHSGTTPGTGVSRNGIQFGM